ncbi:MAG: DNA polymerase III subunit chi [Arenicellales bacterium]
MSQRVEFYLLEQSSDDALLHYACRLLSKVYEAKLSAFILANSAKQMAQIDRLLWAQSDADFIPHALYNSTEGTHPLTKISIGQSLPEQHQFDMLVNLCHGDTITGQNFKRIAELVSADEQHKANARKRYAQWRDQNAELKLHNISAR